MAGYNHIPDPYYRGSNNQANQPLYQQPPPPPPPPPQFVYNQYERPLYNNNNNAPNATGPQGMAAYNYGAPTVGTQPLPPYQPQAIPGQHQQQQYYSQPPLQQQQPQQQQRRDPVSWSS